MDSKDVKVEAVELMKKAADLLLVDQRQTDDNTSNRRSNMSTTPDLQQPSTSSFRPVATELRRLFQPYSRNNNRTRTGRSSAMPTRSTSTSTSKWTHRFFCLASRDSDTVPSPEERKLHFEAGLGEKKITFERSNDVSLFTSTLEEAFSKLKGCGGWELLRTTGGSRSALFVIKPGRNGYSAEFLSSSYLSQALCYIRPIQEDLVLDVEEFEDEEILKHECKSCLKEIPLVNLRDHVELCQQYQNKDENMPIITTKKRNQPICSFMCASEKLFESDMETAIEKLPCPVCQQKFHPNLIETHAAICGDVIEIKSEELKPEEFEKESFEDDEGQHHKKRCIKETLKEMSEVSDPHLIIDTYVSKYMRGRPLNITDESSEVEGKTFEIFISRESLLSDAFSEVGCSSDGNVSFPLDVTFIGEEAMDLGGPRREFLSSFLNQFSERFVKDGFMVSEDDLGKEAYLKYQKANAFESAGLLVGMSLMQGGPVPAIFKDPNNLFFHPSTPIEVQFTKGIEKLGLKQLSAEKKEVLDLFKTSYQKETLTYPKLVKLLKPNFSNEGSNQRLGEQTVYRFFLDYLKEVAAHRRGSLTLQSILKFVTGSVEIPVLGYRCNPTISFQENNAIPTSSTCLCKLFLPNSTQDSKEKCFESFDYAFYNDYFGIV